MQITYKILFKNGVEKEYLGIVTDVSEKEKNDTTKQIKEFIEEIFKENKYAYLSVKTENDIQVIVRFSDVSNIEFAIK